MKRQGFIVVISFILVLSLVSAADYTCPVGTQIFRLSSQSNAMAETVSGTGNYPVHICYDDYFGTLSGTPVRTCSPTNAPILNLSATTNAHAQLPGGSGSYPIGLCFSGLACVARSGVCQLGEKEIVSLSGSTNAHVGINGSYTGVGSYHMCCSVGGSGGVCGNGVLEVGEQCDPPSAGACSSTCQIIGDSQIVSATWTDGMGSPITSSYVNRTVHLRAQTTLSAGTNVTFNLREADILFDDDISTVTVTTNAAGLALVAWNITHAYLAAGQDLLESFPLQFYFNVSTATQSRVSNQLNVYTILGNNTAPFANITGPTHRGMYYQGTQVVVSHASLDREGSVSVSWRIIEDNYASTEPSFVYTFASAGQKTIILRATDAQGASHEDQISVLVLASPGLFAFINQPRHQQVVFDSSPNGSVRTLINASDSYAVSSSGSGCTTSISCLAGRCPNQTENAPSSCTPQGPLNVHNAPQPFSSLYFNWSFNDGDDARAVDGLGNNSFVKRFALPSNTLNDKTVFLTLTHTGTSLIAMVNRTFTLFDSAQCINNGETWVEYNTTTGTIGASFQTRNSLACRGEDTFYGTADDCCPVGWMCTAQGCRTGTSVPQICSDYTNRTTCNDDPQRARLSQQNPGWSEPPACGTLANGSLVSCKCAWNGTSETAGSCSLKKTIQSSTGGSNPDDEENTCIPSSCSYIGGSSSSCVNGLMTLTINPAYAQGSCTPPTLLASQCQPGERTVLCGNVITQLPYFSFLNVGLVLGMLALFYLYKIYTRRS